MTPTITALIFARDNEDEIVDCVESAKLLTPTVQVIDIASRDETKKRAHAAGASVVTTEAFEYVEPARKIGIANVKTEWMFILDADERITRELATEVHDTISKSTHTYFTISRKNIFAKRIWLKHGGWWPDPQMRLIRTKSIKSWPARIHATPIIDGSKGHLNHPFIHYFHGDFTSMVRKTMKYEEIESDLLYEAHRPAGVLIFMRKFAGELYRRLIKNSGYKDGVLGYLESVYQAFSKTITYLYVYEKTHHPTKKPNA